MCLFEKIILCVLCFITLDSHAGNFKSYLEPDVLSRGNSLFNNLLTFEENTTFTEIEKLIAEGRMTDGVALLLEYIEEQENLKNKKEIVKAYSFMADILKNNGDYKQSLTYYYKVDKYIQNDSILLSANCFRKGGNFQKLSELDSAMHHYKMALLYTSNFPELQEEKAKINSNLSGIYYLKRDFDKALEVAQLADSIQAGLGNSVIRAGVLNSIGAIYYMKGDYKKSLKSYKKVLELSQLGNTDVHRRTRSLSYINLAYAYSGLGDFEEAFYHQDMYFTLNDSLQSELKYKEINEIQAKYALVKKTTEINDANLKIKKVQFMSYGLGLILFLIVTGVWFLIKFNKLNRKNMRLEFSQQQLLNENKFKKLEGLMQLRSINAALDGRLEERKKIASILHDNVSALLSSANLHLHASKALLKCDVPEEINKSQEIISEAAAKIRDLSHTLISSVLLKFGLGYAVQDLCEKSSNSQLNIICDCIDVKRYNQNFEIKLHNIVNELVNNILKHSKADEASVVIEDKASKLHLVIKDNGIGFEMDKVLQKDGLGLSQVNYRVLNMGGVFIVKSKPGEGSEIFVSVPIKS